VDPCVCELKAVFSLKGLKITHPAAQLYIPEDLNHQVLSVCASDLFLGYSFAPWL
jgi:hypothetical protein